MIHKIFVLFGTYLCQYRYHIYMYLINHIPNNFDDLYFIFSFCGTWAGSYISDYLNFLKIYISIVFFLIFDQMPSWLLILTPNK